MTTASGVPVTRGELEGDEAVETLRAVGRRRLVLDTVARFRAADGFSHSRALAFNMMVTLIPALFALVGLATTLESGDLRQIVDGLAHEAVPGPAGDVLTESLRDDEPGRGARALVVGLLGTLAAATTTMAQVERSANRIYGVEQDRPFVRRYRRALLLALTAGGMTGAAVLTTLGGAEVSDALDLGERSDAVWDIVRWPLSMTFVIGAVALLFHAAPRRRQPEPSWLAVGALLSATLWLLFMAGLQGWFELTSELGGTYGTLGGLVGLLSWAFLTALALLLGLAFAAQLEAVRAGVPAPRVERRHN